MSLWHHSDITVTSQWHDFRLFYMETYTRKQLMKITGLPDKTLRWLLSKLEIAPVFTTKTACGRPIYHYDYATLVCLHDYIFKQARHKEECNKGVRCKGGCGNYFPKEEMNANQICNHCRRRLWLRHEVYPDKSLKFDKTAFRDILSILNSFKHDYWYFQ